MSTTKGADGPELAEAVERVLTLAEAVEVEHDGEAVGADRFLASTLWGYYTDLLE